MNKKPKVKYYHDSNINGSCIYGDTGGGMELDSRGPFSSFAQAKRDAIEYYQATIRTAQAAIQELRQLKKPKSP